VRAVTGDGRTVPPMGSFLRGFIRTEAFSGVLVLVAATLAVTWANLGSGYDTFWHGELTAGIGDLGVRIDLEHLIGEVAMSAFFLLVGLEIRREITSGHLRTRSARVAPFVAALAGTLLPAAIYLAFALPQDRAGWPIPTVTDIALAVGVFALIAKRLHPAARVLLLSIAVLDDLIGIALLALLSTGSIRVFPLLVAVTLTAITAYVGRRTHLPVAALLLLWFVLLVLLADAGLHQTLSGVFVALAASPDDTGSGSTGANTVERLEAALHPWVSYLVLPVFVLSHAGAEFGTANRTTLAVALGLLIGKPVAVLVALLAVAKLRAFTLPDGLGTRELAVIASLCGVGLTVSSLLASAALGTPGPAILGALGGSLGSIILALAFAQIPRRTRSA
jgi:NhaA family Na+:H+ antiporter